MKLLDKSVQLLLNVQNTRQGRPPRAHTRARDRESSVSTGGGLFLHPPSTDTHNTPGTPHARPASPYTCKHTSSSSDIRRPTPGQPRRDVRARDAPSERDFASELTLRRAEVAANEVWNPGAGPTKAAAEQISMPAMHNRAADGWCRGAEAPAQRPGSGGCERAAAEGTRQGTGRAQKTRAATRTRALERLRRPYARTGASLRVWPLACTRGQSR